MAITLPAAPTTVWVADCPVCGTRHERDSGTMWDLGGQYPGQPESHPTHGFQCVEGQANHVGRPVNWRKEGTIPEPPRRRRVTLDRVDPADPDRLTMWLDEHRRLSVILAWEDETTGDETWEAALVIDGIVQEGDVKPGQARMWRGDNPFAAANRLIAEEGIEL